ncbi:hypothetical protein [Devosia nitrariae]|uniref:Uncharacterized protein n=1 Tax=Devosia nitrariae TaxID=2071872 RepID=A0ABQ5WEZ3_9HYPH|nr:hypothetical protein [Devosia nitrariae]GLQ58075.1 hypothetical protein GCM10010862_53340 [Devosia nitrariae]
MIPATYHFKNIDRALLHPGVEAEIAEARRRDGTESPSRLQARALLRLVMPAWPPRHGWSRIPAE